MSDTVKVEIEIPVIPEDKIPAGMKLGNPMAEKRIVLAHDRVLNAEMKWVVTEPKQIGYFAIVANFVPIEPEEPEFIDRKVEPDIDDMYSVETPTGAGKRFISNISSHTLFVEYLWKSTDGKMILSKSSNNFRSCSYGVCTHVRFINPKYEKGE